MSSDLLQSALKVIAATFTDGFLGQLEIAHLVTRDGDATVAQVGDQVTVPVGPVTNGRAAFHGQITVTRLLETTFCIPNLSSALCDPHGLLMKFAQPATLALASYVERDLLALAPAFTENNPVGRPATRLTTHVIDAAETELFKARVPCESRKYLVVGAEGYSDVRRLPHFRVPPSGPETIMGFSPVRSRHIQPNDAGCTTNLAFAPEALGLVTRRPLPKPDAIAHYCDYDGFSLAFTIVPMGGPLSVQISVELLYGTGVLVNRAGIQVLS